jgi:hypothetical protein
LGFTTKGQGRDIKEAEAAGRPKPTFKQRLAPPGWVNPHQAAYDAWKARKENPMSLANMLNEGEGPQDDADMDPSRDG